MGIRYKHVTIEERCEMARLHSTGHSVRQIAASLDRSPSTVARELKRNGSRTKGYEPVYADQQSRARRWSGSRLERNADLRDRVLSRLQQGWSPDQVAGRLALESGKKVISHETIYRFIYAQLARTKDYSWRRYLPRGKSKRGWRGRKGGSPASFIHLRRSLAERPQDAADRRTPGHWEADLMLFRTYGQAVLTLHERHSRLLIALRPPGKASNPIASAMTQVLGAFPPQWRRTVTFDNGTEFARHHQFHALGVETFFLKLHHCDDVRDFIAEARMADMVDNRIGKQRPLAGSLHPCQRLAPTLGATRSPGSKMGLASLATLDHQRPVARSVEKGLPEFIGLGDRFFRHRYKPPCSVP